MKSKNFIATAVAVVLGLTVLCSCENNIETIEPAEEGIIQITQESETITEAVPNPEPEEENRDLPESDQTVKKQFSTSMAQQKAEEILNNVIAQETTLLGKARYDQKNITENQAVQDITANQTVTETDTPAKNQKVIPETNIVAEEEKTGSKEQSVNDTPDKPAVSKENNVAPEQEKTEPVNQEDPLEVAKNTNDTKPAAPETKSKEEPVVTAEIKNDAEPAAPESNSEVESVVTKTKPEEEPVVQEAEKPTEAAIPPEKETIAAQDIPEETTAAVEPAAEVLPDYVYQTEDFTFTLPEAWRGLVTVEPCAFGNVSGFTVSYAGYMVCRVEFPAIEYSGDGYICRSYVEVSSNRMDLVPGTSYVSFVGDSYGAILENGENCYMGNVYGFNADNIKSETMRTLIYLQCGEYINLDDYYLREADGDYFYSFAPDSLWVKTRNYFDNVLTKYISAR